MTLTHKLLVSLQDRVGLTSTSLAAAAGFSAAAAAASSSLPTAASAPLPASASTTLPASASPDLSGAAPVSTKAADAPKSSDHGMPLWAEEMGMTEEEYWGGLQETGASQADLTGNRITPVQVTQARACHLIVNNHLCDVLITGINVQKA